MSYLRNMIATTKSDIEGSNLIEKDDCDTYSNFNHMGYLFKNFGPSDVNLPNLYDTEFDQDYYDC